MSDNPFTRMRLTRGRHPISGEMVETMATTEQAEGAIPNGTIVEKYRSEPGDTYTDGTRGVVLGSLKVPSPEELGLDGELADWHRQHDIRYSYCVRFEGKYPDAVPLSILSHRIRVAPVEVLGVRDEPRG